MGDQPQADNQQPQEPSIEELQAQELEKLEQSFTKVSSSKDPLRYEQSLVKESRDLSIPLDEYRRLYELSRKKSSTLRKVLYGAWKWTGIGEKKLWDFAQLLLVPILLYVATNYLGDQAKIREKEAAKDRVNQETLNSYLDEMAELLPALKAKEPSYDAKVLAKIRTLTALRTLDGERSNQLLGFLREAKLIGEESSKASRVNFSNANLRGADLKRVDLSGVDLSNAILAKADLSGAKFIGATLTKADFTDAKLDDADFSNAVLTQSTLSSKEDIGKVKANFCGAMTSKDQKSSQGCSTYSNARSGLLVRSSPAGYVIGSLGYGTRLSLTGAQMYAAGRNWYQLSSGGWVVSDYLSTQSPEDSSTVNLPNN